MLGDFLLESRCPNGHTSSAAYRGYAREHVDLVARLLACSCGWPIDTEGDTCGEEMVHTVTPLGASDAHEEAERAAWRADTAPAMTRPELPWNGPRSSRPPPMPEDEGNVTAGD